MNLPDLKNEAQLILERLAYDSPTIGGQYKRLRSLDLETEFRWQCLMHDSPTFGDWCLNVVWGKSRVVLSSGRLVWVTRGSVFYRGR